MFRSLAAAAILALAAAARAALPAADVAGTWQGALDVQGAKLRLVVHLKAAEDSTFTATMDSPDQGATGIPLDVVEIDGDRVRVGSSKLRAEFAGRLVAHGTHLEGTWNQGGLSLPLVLERGAPPEIHRPQTPREPYPYDVEEVTYASAATDVRIAGTLTLPHGDGPFAAVILISGSGAQDRDETIFAHKPFLVLADHLTRHGIAVLRADDRGVGGTSAGAAGATSADFALDVRGGVAFLKQHAKIDAKRIGLVGHSEGGLIGPMVADGSGDIAFLVLLAAPGVPGEEVLYEQAALLGRAAGSTEAEIALNRGLQANLFAVVKRQSDAAALRRDLEAVWRETLAAWDEAARRSPGASEENMQTQIAVLSAPWMRYFLQYDPRPVLRRLRCPVLAVTGEKDLQVEPKQNLRAIEAALRQGGHRDHSIRELPGLNHLLQTCTTGSVQEYGEIEETMSPAALDLMATWIRQHTR